MLKEDSSKREFQRGAHEGKPLREQIRKENPEAQYVSNILERVNPKKGDALKENS